MGALALPIGLGAGQAVIGGVNSALGSREASRQNKIRALQIKNSPWTGREPQEEAKSPNMFSDIFGSALSGLNTGMNIKKGISGSSGNSNISTATPTTNTSGMGKIANVSNPIINPTVKAIANTVSKIPPIGAVAQNNQGQWLNSLGQIIDDNGSVIGG